MSSEQEAAFKRFITFIVFLFVGWLSLDVCKAKDELKKYATKRKRSRRKCSRLIHRESTTNHRHTCKCCNKWK